MPRYDDAVWAAAGVLAGQLDEPNRGQIARIIGACGVPYAERMAARAQDVQAQGGLRTADGTPRTLGGVFFWLVKADLDPATRRAVFPPSNAPPPDDNPPFDWADWPAIVSALGPHGGQVSAMTLELVGRPAQVARRAHLVMLTLHQDLNYPMEAPPRGLPPIPAQYQQVQYTVLVSARQWDRLRPALRTPDAQVHIRGRFAYDPELNTVVVFALEVKPHQPAAAAPAATPKAPAAPTPPSEAERDETQRARLVKLYQARAKLERKLAAQGSSAAANTRRQLEETNQHIHALEAEARGAYDDEDDDLG